ncbi:class I SAM-dependent methyltransferase [Ruania halotolerans]|uniref:class I SAM-dependent methyltransferase n=1 Tax=Ruania halotolerans TaxID=2897773 RepID=UPI001E37A848|nr:class I SAM-dependent methyltransferase [Ruania halotolerans]UFU07967.1 class I SAM-dependent methyltransferase [Ruania halotolerans]
MVEKSLWTQQVERDPNHSHWYVQRFKDMAAEGADLHGEARMIDAMLHRGARVLDAGCGPGRLGGELARRGHTVVGMDVDPVLIEAARTEFENCTWVLQDLAELDLPAAGVTGSFDVAVAAGNVMAFLAPSTRRTVLTNLAGTLADDGRLVVGFGTGRGYTEEEFFDDARDAGLAESVRLATWDLRPWTPDAGFLVAILERSA